MDPQLDQPFRIPLPTELAAEVFSAMHLKPFYRSIQEWNDSVQLLCTSECASIFAAEPFEKRKEFLAALENSLQQRARISIQNWNYAFQVDQLEKRHLQEMRNLGMRHRVEFDEAKGSKKKGHFSGGRNRGGWHGLVGHSFNGRCSLAPIEQEQLNEMLKLHNDELQSILKRQRWEKQDLETRNAHFENRVQLKKTNDFIGIQREFFEQRDPERMLWIQNQLKSI